jgi:hypothetical protein
LVFVFVVKKAKFSQPLLEQSEASDLLDRQPLVNIGENTSQVALGGGFVVGRNSSAEYGAFFERLGRWRDFNPCVRAHREGVSIKPEKKGPFAEDHLKIEQR